MLIVFKNNFPQTGYFLLDFLRKDCKSSSLLVKYRIKLKKILTEMEFSKRLAKCFISQVCYYEGQFLSCIFPEGKNLFNWYLFSVLLSKNSTMARKLLQVLFLKKYRMNFMENILTAQNVLIYLVQHLCFVI